MSLVYCGIDEAGYGPLLGPLCVGLTEFEVEDWSPGEPAPNLWKLLAPAVGASLRDAKARIPVADSKKLKLSNSSKTRHPLIHLERGVLSFLGVAGPVPQTDDELLARLGAVFDDQPWYGGDPIALPLGRSAAELGIDINLLARAMSSAGVSAGNITCRVVGETHFNELVREAGSKGATTAAALSAHLADIAKRHAGREVRIVCDRQGGRQDYTNLLRRSLQTDIEVLEQSPRASRYRAGSITVIFVPEAERGHLPVALASMAAKLVRELGMMRFNRYWIARQPELKPTAGYYTDARRWLDDADSLITPEQRSAMIRIA